MAVPVLVPKLGPAMVGGVLAEWYFPDGASVSRGEPVFRLECDYVAIEVEAESLGVLRHQAADGDICRPGSVAGVVLAPGERMPDSAPDEFGDPAPLAASHPRPARPEDEEIIDWTQQQPPSPAAAETPEPAESREPIPLRRRAPSAPEEPRTESSFDRAAVHDQDGPALDRLVGGQTTGEEPPTRKTPPQEAASGWFAGGPALGMFSESPVTDKRPRRVLEDQAAETPPAQPRGDGDIWRAIAEDVTPASASLEAAATTPVSPSSFDSPGAQGPDLATPVADSVDELPDEPADTFGLPGPVLPEPPAEDETPASAEVDYPEPVATDLHEEEPAPLEAAVAPAVHVEEPAPPAHVASAVQEPVAEQTPPSHEPAQQSEAPGSVPPSRAERTPILFVRASANVSEAAKMKAQLAREWRAAGLRPGDEDIVVRAVAHALRESPSFAGFDDTIGLCALEEEGIAVRLLRGAASRPFRDAVMALAEQAPHSGDDQPSACTVTSFGEFSLDEGIPQLRPGQVIAITMGAVRPGTAYNGDRPEQVPMMTITLAYDAAVIHEGAAVRLLARIRDLVEAPYALLVA